MTSTPWFRFYSEFRTDPKIRRMPVSHRYAFVVLLCLANESSEKGTILGLDDEDLAYELELSLDEWNELKTRLKKKGMIDFETNKIKICNWDKLRDPSPGLVEQRQKTAVRVARFRENDKTIRNSRMSAIRN